ncbi:MAG: hypothetical protein AB1814_04910 [Thermodesulfobacteriota bacterium]
MSRLVIPPGGAGVISLSTDNVLSLQGQVQALGGKAAPAKVQQPYKKKGDDYLARVAKYVPSEIIAAYITAIGLISTVAEPRLKWWLYLVFLVLCLVFTPIYFNQMAKKGEPKAAQIVISTLAFLVWAYSFGGFFQLVGIYHSVVASLLLIAFTLVSGLFVPKPN